VPQLVLELLYPDALLPVRATEESAGYDLHAYLAGRSVRCSDGTQLHDHSCDTDPHQAHIILTPGLMALIPLGFKARLPSGFEAQVRPRSGAAFKRGLHIPNAPGTIDADYPDEWLVPVQNGGAHPLRIAHGERIAQMVVHRFEVLELVRGAVGVSSTRTGGFGSTGR
jgi:dUTP pyrophosphatase